MFVDLSHTIEGGMLVFPGDDPVSVSHVKDYAKDGYNNFSLLTGMHAGTHLDGPMHMSPDKRYISDFPLGTFAGKACVLNAAGQKIISFNDEFREQVSEGDIVLIYTGFDKKFGSGEYFTVYPVIEEELIEFLVRKKIKMLGIDFPSPDESPHRIHNMLFENNIFILENLTNLNMLVGKEVEIFAFPLKINADSSVVRAVAKISL